MKLWPKLQLEKLKFKLLKPEKLLSRKDLRRPHLKCEKDLKLLKSEKLKPEPLKLWWIKPKLEKLKLLKPELDKLPLKINKNTKNFPKQNSLNNNRKPKPKLKIGNTKFLMNRLQQLLSKMNPTMIFQYLMTRKRLTI